jgi:hypothetical protein
MFVCLFDNDTVMTVDDVYCDIGNIKTGFSFDCNGVKVFYRGMVVDILQFYDDWN